MPMPTPLDLITTQIQEYYEFVQENFPENHVALAILEELQKIVQEIKGKIKS